MTIRKKIALAALPLALAAGLTGTAYAHGGGWMHSALPPEEFAAMQAERFERQASVLGLSVDVVKGAWAEGRTMKDLISQYGLDESAIQERMLAERQAQMKARMQSLVDKGVITQAQADQRVATMAARAATGSREGYPMGGRGGHGRGFGF